MPASAVIAGHTDSVLCCEVPAGGKLLASGGEDGAICLTDLTTLKPAGRIEQSLGEAVPSLCWHPGEDHRQFAAAGAAVMQIDLRRGLDASAVLCIFAVNQEEVNSVAVSAANGGWLAAGDDSGEVQVISLQQQQPQQQQQQQQQQQLQQQEQQQQQQQQQGDSTTAAALSMPVQPASYKTLRRSHSNICSAVAFRPHRPWELLSGGLDATVVKWDYSRLRPLHSWSLSSEATASGGQLFNPPMVHSIAVPITDDRALCRLMAVARGDGCISLYDADYKATTSSNNSGGGRASGSKKGGKVPQKAGSQQQAAAAAGGPVPGRLALLGRQQGGHRAAVNTVSFLRGSDWQQLLSAGNDCRLLLWNWRAAQAAAADAAEGAGEPSSSSLRQGGRQEHGDQQQKVDGAAGAVAAATTAAADGSSSLPLLAAEHQHTRKINWACSVADLPGCPYNVFLADTGRRITTLKLA